MLMVWPLPPPPPFLMFCCIYFLFSFKFHGRKFTIYKRNMTRFCLFHGCFGVLEVSGLGLGSPSWWILVLQPFLVSRVDLPGLAASSKQQASKQQASKQHARNGEKSELRRGASDSAEILVDDTYGCEVQSHKVRARNSTVAAGNRIRKWRTSVSKTAA